MTVTSKVTVTFFNVNGRLPLLLLVFLLLALPVRMVRANDGPHGDYAPTTDACATWRPLFAELLIG